MSTTRELLANPPRPARPVTLPGGLAVHVRDLTLAELRRIDKLADQAAEGERGERYLELLALYVLAEADGRPAFPDSIKLDLPAPMPEDLDIVRGLTIEQLYALAKEARGDKADAKKD